MYINEVIRRCDTLAPNNYTQNEKYAWCDELNAMLAQEYLKKYRAVELEPDSKGTYLLPEGITFEMVEKIISGTRELDKYDLRSYGIRFIYGTRAGRIVIPERAGIAGNITVIYIEQTEPIRTVTLDLTDTAVGIEWIVVPADHNLVEGDLIRVTLGGWDDGRDDVIYELPIVEITVDKVISLSGESPVSINDKYLLILPEDCFDDLITPRDFSTCKVERIVTDETLCPPPYDTMYVEFVLAKMSQGQKNYNIYNQHMNIFNQKLRAYHNWLNERRVQNKDNKMRNWW